MALRRSGPQIAGDILKGQQFLEGQMGLGVVIGRWHVIAIIAEGGLEVKADVLIAGQEGELQPEVKHAGLPGAAVAWADELMAGVGGIQGRP